LVFYTTEEELTRCIYACNSRYVSDLLDDISWLELVSYTTLLVFSQVVFPLLVICLIAQSENAWIRGHGRRTFDLSH